jgi:hypothetical protein
MVDNDDIVNLLNHKIKFLSIHHYIANYLQYRLFTDNYI